MSAPVDRSSSLEVAMEHVAAEEAIWFRAGAVREEARGWQVRLLELTSGDVGFPPVAGHAVMRPAVLAVDSR